MLLGTVPSAIAEAKTEESHDSYDYVVNVVDYQADPTGQNDSIEAIQKAIDSLKDKEGKKLLVFPEGTYQIYPDKSVEKELYVSNTVGTDQTYKNKKLDSYLKA